MIGESVPDEVVTTGKTITLSEGRETAEVTVGSTGNRPIRIGFHFHFFEANAALSFDREATYGMRLNIPVGTAVRFESGDQTSVELAVIDGKRQTHGIDGTVSGSIDTNPSAAVERLHAAGFTDAGAPDDKHGTAEESSERRRTSTTRPMPTYTISRRATTSDWPAPNCSPRSRRTSGHTATRPSSTAGRHSATVWGWPLA